MVCTLEKHVACVDISIALQYSCASHEPVLSHFDQFLTFGCAARAKTSEMVFPECALERAPFERRTDLLARKARCSRRCRYCTSFRLRITRARSQPCRPIFDFWLCRTCKNVGNGFPGCAQAPFERRIGLLARKARCLRRCRYCVSPVAHHVGSFSAISTNF